MSDHQRSTDGMIEFNKGKSISKTQAVNEAIKRLIKSGLNINFNSVVSEANVSKSYLYNHPDHRRRIEELRGQQLGRSNLKKTRNEKSEASKDLIIVVLTNKIKELKTKVSYLEEENKKLRGKFYDNI